MPLSFDEPGIQFVCRGLRAQGRNPEHEGLAFAGRAQQPGSDVRVTEQAPARVAVDELRRLFGSELGQGYLLVSRQLDRHAVRLRAGLVATDAGFHETRLIQPIRVFGISFGSISPSSSWRPIRTATESGTRSPSPRATSRTALDSEPSRVANSSPSPWTSSNVAL